MSEITYDDKVDLQVATNIANINKVTASDMNQIKSVVNNNADDVGDITSLTTTDKTSIVNAVNELNTGVNELNAPEKWVSVGTEEPTDGRRVWFAKGKNLFDDTQGQMLTNATTSVENNEITITTTRTTTNNNLFYRGKIDDSLLTNGNTYVLSYVAVSGVARPFKLQLRNHDGSNANQPQQDSVTYNSTYSLFVVGNPFAETTDVSVPQGSVCVVKNMQVEQGSTATTYEPYVEPSINVDGEEWYNPNNIEKYSTNEIKIGTWIDGKPIYRSIFDISTISSSNANLVDLDNLNINFIINLRGTIKDTNNYEYPIPLSDSSSNYNVVFYNGRYIRGRCAIGSGASVAIAKVILEYTKTTD